MKKEKEKGVLEGRPSAVLFWVFTVIFIIACSGMFYAMLRHCSVTGAC